MNPWSNLGATTIIISPRLTLRYDLTVGRFFDEFLTNTNLWYGFNVALKQDTASCTDQCLLDVFGKTLLLYR